MDDTLPELKLHVPKLNELWFRRSLLSDPATMSYNAPWFPPDGCIPFPETAWESWYKDWIGSPERFYAYIELCDNGSFIGEVNYHYDAESDAYEIGILISAEERGRGFGRKALELLIGRAFDSKGVNRLSNVFETSRAAALKIHLDCGFAKTPSDDELVHLILEKEGCQNTIK